MTGRRVDRGRQVLVLCVALAVLAAAGVAVVVARQLGHRSGRPQVVQLPSPTAPAPRAVPTAPVSTVSVRPASPVRWAPCGGVFSCARLAVPLDWSHTDPAATGRTVGLALIRARATGPASARLGSLVVNPGGPGGSGVSFVRADLSAIPAAVRARFDVVGFDPRGTGASAPVHCLTGAELDTLYAEPPYPATAQQAASLFAAAAREAAACGAAMGDELRHLSTVDAARDLDAIRAALGEPRLTYLGYSYGTYLGATYARLFPTHIRAFVLDGAIDPTLTGTQLIAGQATGFEGAFDAFAAWCVGNQQCPFGAADGSAAAVESGYRALAAQVAVTPLPGIGSRRVTAGLFLTGTLATLYDRTHGWPALGTALSLAQSGAGGLLLQLADGLLGRNADGSYDPESEANLAINCSDHTYPATATQAGALAAALAPAAPIFGRAIAWSGIGCAAWPVRAVQDTAPVVAPGAPAILVLGTTRDPATPYGEAVALARQLDGGTLLSYDGDGHTAYRASGSGCVQRVVNAYLISLAAPSRVTGARC